MSWQPATSTQINYLTDLTGIEKDILFAMKLKKSEASYYISSMLKGGISKETELKKLENRAEQLREVKQIMMREEPKEDDRFQIVDNNEKKYFLMVGPWENWNESLVNPEHLWGVKKDDPAVFNKCKKGDIVFFYQNKSPEILCS